MPRPALCRRLVGRTLAIAAVAALALAGCSSSAPEPPDPDEGVTTTSAEPPEETSTASPEEPTDEPTDAVALPECEPVLLESGAEISGADLSACMSAAMLAAGSGSHVVETSTGTSTVDFQWTPEFSMHSQGDIDVVVRGDTGWVDTGTGWVRGDPDSSDPQEAMAGTLLELVRAFGDPRGMTSIFTQTSWQVVEEAPVPATGAVTDTAWLLQPQGTMEMFGVAMSDVQLWLGADHLGVYFVGTGSTMGVTETTSNTFTQWGEPVEIPDPGA